jgi:hypothetical protein
MIRIVLLLLIAGFFTGLWWWSGIVGRRRLDAEDQALIARTKRLPAAGELTPAGPLWRTAPARPAGWSCPHCGITRCRTGLEGGNCLADGLTQRTAYWRTVALGRHELSVAVARWIAGSWGQEPLPVAVRRRLGWLAGTDRTPTMEVLA